MVELARLTELTLMRPDPHVIPGMATGAVDSATPQLVYACRALPDFYTLQIVRILLGEPVRLRGSIRVTLTPTDQREQALRG